MWPLFRGFGGLYYAKLRWNRPKTKKAHISVWPNARKRCFDKLVLIWRKILTLDLTASLSAVILQSSSLCPCKDTLILACILLPSGRRLWGTSASGLQAGPVPIPSWLPVKSWWPSGPALGWRSKTWQPSSSGCGAASEKQWNSKSKWCEPWLNF